jgi:hypothetical protein
VLKLWRETWTELGVAFLAPVAGTLKHGLPDSKC